MARTLVVHTGGLGDFLLTMPALVRLAETGPIELLGRADRLELAVAAGVAAAAHEMDLVRFDTVFSKPSADLRRFLGRFDKAVVWMEDDGVISRAFHECGIGDVRTFRGVPPKDWPDHASQYYLRCLGFEAAPALRLAIAAAPTGHDVILHPGSGGRRKNWPLENFKAIAAALQDHGRKVAWCVGPAEESLELPQPEQTVKPNSLLDAARALAASNLYIGNDSGITHLAAAVDCRTIAVFGPTDPRVWAPRGSHVTALRGSPWPSVAAVLAAI